MTTGGKADIFNNIKAQFTVRKLLRIAKYPTIALQQLHHYAFVEPLR